MVIDLNEERPNFDFIDLGAKHVSSISAETASNLVHAQTPSVVDPIPSDRLLARDRRFLYTS